MRFYLGTHKFPPTLGLFGVLGWFPFKLYREIEAVGLWNRLVTMPESRTTNVFFVGTSTKVGKTGLPRWK